MTFSNKQWFAFITRGLTLVCCLIWGQYTLAHNNAVKNRLLVMGDSLSAAHNIPLEAGWVNLLEQQLADDWEVINASISGETSAGGVARLPGILAEYQPDWVFIELGANDGLRALSTKALAENLEQMIDLSKAANAQVLLLGIQIPDNYGPIYQQRFAEVYQQTAQRKQIPLVPFLLEGVATKAELTQADGLHPKASAQAIIKDTVWTLWQQRLD